MFNKQHQVFDKIIWTFLELYLDIDLWLVRRSGMSDIWITRKQRPYTPTRYFKQNYNLICNSLFSFVATDVHDLAARKILTPY